MATDSEIVAKAVEGALEEIKKYAPEEYAKLNADPQKKEAIVQAARSAATEQVKLAKELAGQPDDIAERLAKHLPENRIKMIKEGLNLPTFRIDITKKSDGKHLVEVTREGKTFKPSRELAALSDIDWGTILQQASIVVEAVLLVLSAVGISVSPGGDAMDAAVKEVVDAIKNDAQLEQAVLDFISSWKAAGNDAWLKAKAIFVLIGDCFSDGIFWPVVKSLCSNMAWYDWLETVAKVTATIVAALATEGTALIAEIALIVLDAVDFARKIANIGQLNTIKGTL